MIVVRQAKQTKQFNSSKGYRGEEGCGFLLELRDEQMENRNNLTVRKKVIVVLSFNAYEKGQTIKLSIF